MRLKVDRQKSAFLAHSIMGFTPRDGATKAELETLLRSAFQLDRHDRL